MKCKLSDICLITSSKRIFEREYVDKGIPFIRGQEVSDGSIANKNTKFECYISKERYNEIKKKYIIPKKGDILITAVGTIGNLYYVEDDFEFYFKDGNLILFTNFSEKVYPKYLYYFMQSNFFRKQIEYSMIGAVQKALTIVMLSKIEIELPTYEEQVKIATILDKIDVKISSNIKINVELEKMAKTIYDYWFLQFDFPDKDGKPYKSSGRKMEWNEELKREIPEEWNVKCLEDIMIENCKSCIQVNQVKNNNIGEIPFFTSGEDIYKYDKALICGKNCYINTGGNANVKYYIGEAAYSTDTWCITSKDNLENYMYLLINSLGDILNKKYFAGTGLKHLQKDLFRKMKIVIPSEEVLNKFNDIANLAFEKISKNYIENEKLKSLKDFLLPLLMNGQVKI